MTMLRGGEPVGVPLEAFAHHFGAEADLPVGSFVRIAHAMATVVVPVIVILASYAFTFLAPRARPSNARGSQPAVVAFSSADRGGASGSEDLGRSDERAIQPVDRFYRVTFANEAAFREWTKRVIEFTALLEDVAADVLDPRPAVLVQLAPAPGAQPYAYVSVGARGLGSALFGGTRLDPSPVPLSELPDGLGLLFGEPSDAATYERRAERVAAVFRDKDGMRWSVTRKPLKSTGRVGLEFVSDAGDRVTRDVVPLDEDAWRELNEVAWRAILHDTSGGQRGELDV